MAGDAVWLEVLPALDQFANRLTAGTTKAAGDAGKSAGGAFSALFARAAGDVVVKDETAKIEKAAAQAEKAVEQSTRGIAQARAQQREAAAKTLEAEQKLADAQTKFGEGSKQAQAAAERLAAAQERGAEAARKTENAEKALKAAHGQAAEAADQLAKAQEKASGEGDKHAGVWGRLSSSFGKANTATGGLIGKIGGLAAAGLGAITVANQLGDAWSQAIEKSRGTGKITASLGLNANQKQAAGDASSTVYASGLGSSMSDVTAAVGSVMSSIKGMRDASSKDLADVTTKAMAFGSAFDVDVSEAARNAGILISTGLAPDATAAFDLMTASLQQVPQALRGEVMDATQEYSQYFSRLGYTGSEALSMIGQAAATDGQYGIDKMGDAVKEFSVRFASADANTKKALSSMGLDFGSLSTQIALGGDSARGATKTIVDGLLDIKDPAKQAETAIMLFGTPLEDLGQDSMPKFLESLRGTTGGLGDVSGKSMDMAAQMQSTVDPIEQVKRSLTTTISEGLEPFAGPAQKVADWAKENPGLLQGVVVALGLLSVAMGVATVAMWAMSMTPVALIVGGIVLAVGLLVAGIVLLAQNWDTVWAGIQSVVQVVGDWFAGPFAGFFVGAWNGMIDGIKAAWDAVSGWFAGLWQGISDGVTGAFQGVIDWVSGVFGAAWQAVLDAWFGGPLDNVRKIVEVFGAAIGMVFTAIWNGIVAGATWMWGYVTAGWQWMVDTVTGALNWLWGQIMAIWTAISGFLTPYIDGIVAWVTDRWNGLVNGVTGALTWLRDQVTAIWNDLSNRVHGVVDPMASWLSEKFSWISTKAGEIFEGMRAKVVDVFERMQAGIGTAWDKVKDVFSKPVRWVADIVVNPLIRGFNTLAEKVGMPQNKLSEWKFDGFASGGYTGPGAKYQPAGIVHAGEIVWSQDDIRRHGGISRVEAMRTGGGAGYANGGVVQPVPGVGNRHTSGYSWATWAGDFPVPTGTPVKSWKDGIVALVQYLTTSYGRHVRVNHDDGSSSLYAHLQNAIVSVGQRLNAGQVLGYSDSTGNSTGPHLHFETSGAPYNGSSGGGGFDLLGAITQFISGPMNKLKELGDSGFGGLVKSLPGKIVEGMKSKLMSAWDGISGAVQSGGNYAIASAMAAGRGWGPGDIASLLWLIQKESGGRVNATNPSSGAYGIPQALPGSKMASAGADWRTNPATQIRWMLDYIGQRYGSASAAKAFHLRNNWYDQGGQLQPGTTLVVNGTGQPEAVLTGRQWDVAAAAIRTATAADGGSGNQPAIYIDRVEIPVGDLEELRTVEDFFRRLTVEAVRG